MDPSKWKSQIFAPPDDLIATAQLEFELSGLKPATEYKIKIYVKLLDFGSNPTSEEYTVKTLSNTPSLPLVPSQTTIDARLRAIHTNATWIEMTWKKFSVQELQFIDGVQLRFREQNVKVYTASPLIHRSITNYVIGNLKPSTTYEVGIVFIPFPGQNNELIDEKTVSIPSTTRGVDILQ